MIVVPSQWYDDDCCPWDHICSALTYNSSPASCSFVCSASITTASLPSVLLSPHPTVLSLPILVKATPLFYNSSWLACPVIQPWRWLGPKSPLHSTIVNLHTWYRANMTTFTDYWGLFMTFQHLAPLQASIHKHSFLSVNLYLTHIFLHLAFQVAFQLMSLDP